MHNAEGRGTRVLRTVSTSLEALAVQDQIGEPFHTTGLPVDPPSLKTTQPFITVTFIVIVIIGVNWDCLVKDTHSWTRFLKCVYSSKLREFLGDSIHGTRGKMTKILGSVSLQFVKQVSVCRSFVSPR